MASKDFGSMLNKPHLQAAENTVVPPDPRVPTRVRVTLEQLIPYDGNPRKSKNPDYDEIKESIRNRGLDHPPNITREKPTDPYMIKDGGNTRLQILNELWEETQEQRFYELECMFHPWTDDLDILVGHMVENELRGRMLFIERAIAASRIKGMLEKLDNKELSIRESSKRITSIGWTIDHSALAQLLYSHDILFPVIPEAFWSGIGRDSVKKIRKLLETSRKYWDQVSNQDDSQFEDIWPRVFTALDGGFDIDEAENKLTSEMALLLDGPITTVRAQLQAITEGVDIPIKRPSQVESAPAISEKKPTPENKATTQGALNQSPTVKSEPLVPEETSDNVVELRPDSTTPTDTFSTEPEINEAAKTAPPLQTQDIQEPELGAPSSFKYLLELTTEELQGMAGDTAVTYAERHNLAFCVARATDVGFHGQDGWHSGFVVYPPNQEQLDFIRDDLGYVVNYQYLFQLSIALRSSEVKEVPQPWNTSPHPLNQDRGHAEFTDYFSIKAPNVRAFILGMMLHDDDPASGHTPAFQMLTELEAIIGVLMNRMMTEQGRLW